MTPALTSDAIMLEMPFEIEDVLTSKIAFYFTPDFATAVAPAEPENASSSSFASFEEEAAIPPAGFSGSADFQPFDPFNHSSAEGMPRGMDMIMDIPLEVSVELGRVRMLIKDVLALSSGSIVELERIAGEPVDLLVNGRLVARGEVVVIDDNFGIRITEIVSPADRVSSLGKN